MHLGLNSIDIFNHSNRQLSTYNNSRNIGQVFKYCSYDIKLNENRIYNMKYTEPDPIS